MVQLQIRVDGEHEVIRTLETKKSRGKNMRKPLADSSAYMQDRIQSNIDRGGAIYGKWQARKHRYSHRMLVKTGRMRRGFQESVNSKRAVISNKVSYFKYHQRGTNSIPRRRMLGINNEDERRIQKIFQAYIMKD